ncbi:MAG: hypothetical protein IJ325_12080 [Clostridia bacterium]|nr:hypothetical protein [Clostridia bacterium]
MKVVTVLLYKGTTDNLNVICGHYGSGKTNIAVNLALSQKANCPGSVVNIADLDIVNPYFRTADAADILKRAGVNAMIPLFANSNVDIPVMPDAMQTMFDPDKKDQFSFIDVGGDDGAVALGMYAERIKNCGYGMIYVVSMYRPLTADPKEAAELLREIEEVSHLKCTGMINNSSVGAETTAEDVLAAVEWAHTCAECCSLPLLCHSYYQSLLPELPEIFSAAGYGDEILLPMINVTKQIF